MRGEHGVTRLGLIPDDLQSYTTVIVDPCVSRVHKLEERHSSTNHIDVHCASVVQPSTWFYTDQRIIFIIRK